jgi:hypothetical protein
MVASVCPIPPDPHSLLASFSVESRCEAVKLLHNFLFLLPTDTAIVLTLRKSGLAFEAMKLFAACSLVTAAGGARAAARVVDGDGQLRLKEFCVGFLVKEKDVSAASTMLEQLLATKVPTLQHQPGLGLGLECVGLSATSPPPLSSPLSLLQAMRRDAQAAAADGGEDGGFDEEQCSLQLVRALAEEVARGQQQNASSAAESSARFAAVLSNISVVVQLLLAVGEHQGGDGAVPSTKPLRCAVPSQLFLRTLQRFLSSEEGGRSSAEVAGDAADGAVELDKPQAAFVVLTLLQSVPLDLLLSDGRFMCYRHHPYIAIYRINSCFSQGFRYCSCCLHSWR